MYAQKKNIYNRNKIRITIAINENQFIISL